MAQPAAAVPAPALSDEQRQIVALVKELNVEGLRSFLEARPHFDCDLVSPDDFASDKSGDLSPFATALFWLCCASPTYHKQETWEGSRPEASIVRLLVQRGADVGHRYGPEDKTLLHMCEIVQPVQLLLELGADVVALDKGGRTPLHYRRCPESCRALLRVGARVNQQNYAGQTPLYRRIDRLLNFDHDWYFTTDFKSVDVLLDAGASWTTPDTDGVTPLELLFRPSAMPLITQLRADVLGRLAGDFEIVRSARTWLQRMPADLTVQLPSKHLQVHRWLFSAASDTFRALLSSGMREATEGVLVLKDVPEAAFEHMVEWAYGKPMPALPWAELAELTRVADQFLMSGLKQRCEEQLLAMVSVDSAVDSLLFADALHLESLKLKSIKLIADNWLDVAKSKGFLEALRLPQFAALQIEIVEHIQQISSKKRKRDDQT